MSILKYHWAMIWDPRDKVATKRMVYGEYPARQTNKFIDDSDLKEAVKYAIELLHTKGVFWVDIDLRPETDPDKFSMISLRLELGHNTDRIYLSVIETDNRNIMGALSDIESMIRRQESHVAIYPRLRKIGDTSPFSNLGESVSVETPKKSTGYDYSKWIGIITDSDLG